MERLLDQYELNIASSKPILTGSLSDDAITSSLLHTRFTSPNSGHAAQILSYLREHASTFDNYSLFFKNDGQQQFDEDTNVLKIRWEAALDYLNEDEKKYSAMLQHESTGSNSFHVHSTTNIVANMNNVIDLNDSNDASQRRRAFHIKSLDTRRTGCLDDDDDDDNVSLTKRSGIQ